MATSPTTKSAATSGAAKDDAIGNDGVFHYSYSEMLSKLLANDPGGANKLADHFFFGDATVAHDANGGIPTVEQQATYLESLGIDVTLSGSGANAQFVSFDISATAQDFNYMVQIGNKGTWSMANVDIADRPDPVVVEALGTMAILKG